MLSILNLDTNLEKIINSILFEINLTSYTRGLFKHYIDRRAGNQPIRTRSPHPVCQLFIRVSDIKLFMDVAFPKILVKIK